MSARCAKALIGAVPRRSLVLSIAGKNIPSSSGRPLAALLFYPQQHLGHALSKQPRPGQGLGECISVSPYLYQQ